MKSIWRRIEAEWEVAICALAALVFCATLGLAWVRLHANDEQQSARKQAKRQPSLLGSGAYAFLQPIPEPATDATPSPFLFEGTLKEKKQSRASKPRKTSKPEPTPKPPPVAKVEQPKEPAAAPKPPEPEPPKIVRRYVYGDREIKYVFSGRGTSGKPAATIQMRDPRTGQTAPLSVVPVGGMIDGIKVVGVDRSYLTVLDARRVQHRIAFGKTARVKSGPVVVEVPQ